MEITWLSNNTFTIQSTNGSLVINPTTKDHLHKNNIVVHSTASSNVELDRESYEDAYNVNWPGEYEANGTLFVGVEASSDKEGMLSTMYAITLPEKITVGYIGDVQSRPHSKSIQKLGNIDVLLMEIDESSSLKISDIVGIIEEVDAKVVVPFFANAESPAALSKILSEQLGEALKSLKIQKSHLADEGTTYTLLEPQS